MTPIVDYRVYATKEGRELPLPFLILLISAPQTDSEW